jgi:hypothetical protein
MKRLRLTGLLITVFLVTAAFSGCGPNNTSKNTSNDTGGSTQNGGSDNVPALSAGNTNGNINNSGLASLRDGWIFYNSGAGLYKVKTDGTGSAKLNGDTSWWINAAGEWVYYANGSDGYKLYKIKADGTGAAKLSDERMYSVHVVGDWIYYTDYSDAVENSGKIYRLKTDGTGKALLSDTVSNCINVTGGWVYYSSGSALFKVKTDGSGKVKLTEDNSYYNVVGDINVSGEWIYFTEYSEYSGKLMKVKTDGSGKAAVSSGMSRHVNVAGSWIYYINADDNSALYKMKTDGSDKKSLDSGASSFPNVVGDWIYYYDDTSSEYCRIRTDGTEKTFLTPKSDSYVLPESSTRYLSDQEAASLDADQLALARNEIFARHGYVFTSQKYKDYFSSKSWYVPNPSFKGDFSELNEYEVYNVQLIQKYEAKNQGDSTYILPDSSARYLTDSDIASLSKEQLALARNEIFARHGYVFTSQKYKDYFSSKSWYVPNPDFSGDVAGLNSYEQKNVALIQKAEVSRADQLVYITSIDKDSRRISYDLTSGIVETEDGYAVKNESTLIRTKKLAADASFYILKGGSSELEKTDFQGLLDKLQDGYKLFNLEIEGDYITSVVQQYMP